MSSNLQLVTKIHHKSAIISNWPSAIYDRFTMIYNCLVLIHDKFTLIDDLFIFITNQQTDNWSASIYNAIILIYV